MNNIHFIFLLTPNLDFFILVFLNIGSSSLSRFSSCNIPKPNITQHKTKKITTNTTYLKFIREPFYLIVAIPEFMY